MPRSRWQTTGDRDHVPGEGGPCRSAEGGMSDPRGEIRSRWVAETGFAKTENRGPWSSFWFVSVCVSRYSAVLFVSWAGCCPVVCGSVRRGWSWWVCVVLKLCCSSPRGCGRGFVFLGQGFFLSFFLVFSLRFRDGSSGRFQGRFAPGAKSGVDGWRRLGDRDFAIIVAPDNSSDRDSSNCHPRPPWISEMNPPPRHTAKTPSSRCRGSFSGVPRSCGGRGSSHRSGVPRSCGGRGLSGASIPLKRNDDFSLHPNRFRQPRRPARN